MVVKWSAFNSDNPSSNPAEADSFFLKFEFEKNENKQKRGRGWPIKNKFKTWRTSLNALNTF